MSRCCQLILGLMLVLSGFMPATSAAELLIAGGQPRAQIIIAPEAPRTVKLAATELQTVLQKMTGATLPITHAPSSDWPLQIYIGVSAGTEQRQLSTDGLRHGAYRIASGDNWLALLGADRDFVPVEPWGHSPTDAPRVLREWDAITGETFGNPFVSMWRKHDARDTGLWEFDLDNAGSFQAVAHVLRALGVRWYMPGPLGEFIPPRQDVELPQLNQTYTPHFALRNIYQMGTNFFASRDEEIRWQLQLGVNQGMDPMGFGPNDSVAHGLKRVIEREETKRAHPEMYQLLGGKRQTERGVPCLRSEQLIAAHVRYLRQVFDHYDVPMQSVMPTDGFTRLCECDLCRGLDTPERGRRGELSDYVWGYVVRVASELLKTHPDRKLHCLAYTTYQLPPLHIERLPPNVVVGIAQNRSTFRLPEQQALIQEIRAGWRSRITSDCLLYEYEYYLQEWPSRPWHGLPVLYPQLIVADLRQLRGISQGEYIEAFRIRQPTPTNLLNIYLTARLMWDVDQDLHALLDEYFVRMFGPAQQPMRQFYELVEAHWSDLQPEHVQQLFALLDAATPLAGESYHAQRIALIRASVTDGLNRVLAQNARVDALELKPLAQAGFAQDDDPAALPHRALVDMLGRDVAVTPTSAALGWDGQDVVVHVLCTEPEMASVRAVGRVRHDTMILRDDAVHLALAHGESYYELVVNPAGQWIGLDRARQGLDGLGWEEGIKVEVARDRDQWSVEIRLTPQALGMTPPTPAQPWRLNLARTRPRGLAREQSSLIPTGQATLGVVDRMAPVFIPNQENP